MKPLTVIMVTHNRLEYSKRTLASIIRTVPHARIFIYDNDSTEEGMQQWLTDTIQDGVSEIYYSAENKGWAGAVNSVLEEGPLNEFILLTNNDVEYYDGWYEKLLSLYEKYPQVGIMGVWKHRAHGVSKDHGDLVEKDDMPATGWLMKKSILDDVGPIPERGPCSTKGGNGEDTNYVNMVKQKGYLIGAPKEDVAIHIDGY